MRKQKKTYFGPVAQWLLVMSVGTVVLVFLIAYRPPPKVKVAPVEPVQTTSGYETSESSGKQTAIVIIAFLIGLLVLRFQYKRVKVLHFRKQLRDLLEHQQKLADSAKQTGTTQSSPLADQSHQHKESKSPSLELLE